MSATMVFSLTFLVMNFPHTSNHNSLKMIALSVLYLRLPKWVCPSVSAMCGSDWESRSTAATHGTPKPTTTRLFLTSVAAVLTGSTSARLPRTASNTWPPTTWPWWGWRSWTVDALLVITGESTVASLLCRNAQNNLIHAN